jgi:lipopolysaccharide/colanic/teichoic acid biosynthesis glycosyltransferase
MIESQSKNQRCPSLRSSNPAAKQVESDMKLAPKAMYSPRYVSAWCLSRRKRCFDCVVSVVALVLFSPIMAVIAILIRLTSQGPALFCQERVGLHQKTFTIFKFRTMKIHSERLEHGPTVTRQGDPRMTKLGRVLRNLKLDELPQLINVARGDMSLVGPRPKIVAHENLCMLCRPGITGAATIQFSHEEALVRGVPEDRVEHYVTTVLNPEKCRLDMQYIETANFRTDLRILFGTVFKLSYRKTQAKGGELTRFRPIKANLEMHALPDESDFASNDIRQSA